VPHSAIYLSDAGANALWRVPLGGGTAATLLTGLNATAKRVRWFSGPTTRPAPGITSMSFSSGTNVAFGATNGFAGGTYYLLTATNAAAPLSQWLPLLTNTLAASGNFALTATNSRSSNRPAQFFLLQVR
jgi:hypothetical protein